ncbi:MAG: response regulator transcription factor [Anaerolineae bacterium]|nr:response regulator transcription factor [Anaerolineae bacterium]
MPEDAIRILIADDHAVVRTGLCALLDRAQGMLTVGEATDSEQALQKANELRPDVVLLDISMPGPGGIEVTKQLKDMLPQTRVLILTVHKDERLLQEAIRAGASGYVTKNALEPELINAIHAVHRGDLYVHPTMTRALLQSLEQPAQKPPSSAREGAVEALTSREIEVLHLIAQGYTNRQAADKLGISVRTVETHRANIMGKLNVSGRVELVRYAMEHGLLDT